MATDTPTTPTTSIVPKTTGDDYLQLLRNRSDSHYLGSQDLDKLCEFFVGGVSGNHLVLIQDDDNLIEFIMSGIFEIDRRDFFFTADANFDPTNNFNAQFSKTKATCRLLPVKRHPLYDFAKKHFPAYINTLASMERKAPVPPSAMTQSVIVRTDEGTQAIKLSHALFKPTSVRDDSTQEPNTDTNTDDATKSVSEQTKDNDHQDQSHYDIHHWPVTDRNKDSLAEIADTHRVIPIPVYNTDHVLINPSDYQAKLAGAIVEVHFALKHFYLKSKNKSIFSAILREMVILRGPLRAVQSPPKNTKRHDPPATTTTTKTKKARKWCDIIHTQHTQR